MLSRVIISFLPRPVNGTGEGINFGWEKLFKSRGVWHIPTRGRINACRLELFGSARIRAALLTLHKEGTSIFNCVFHVKETTRGQMFGHDLWFVMVFALSSLISTFYRSRHMGLKRRFCGRNGHSCRSVAVTTRNF